ncbi:MAG: peptide chain release factor aRF-1 [Candidatus Bathyarchaeota archaeon]
MQDLEHSKDDKEHSKSLELYRTKKLLDTLASKEGRHTELITLLVPPDRQISEVMNNLRQESGTASNIKSRTTRHNVEAAISKVIQRLKLFKEPPPTGLSLFCGAIPYGPPGSEKMEIYMIIPPEPIKTYLYRCDSHFHLGPLLEMVKERETFGILVLDGGAATFSTLRGSNLRIIKSITSGISSKHRAGGQSARRFERIRDIEVNEFYKRIARYVAQVFMGIPDFKGLVVGGPGPTKQDFLDGDHLHYFFRDKILSVVDTAYVDEQGVKEIVVKAPEILRNVRYVEERNLVQQFLYELGHNTGLVTYGEQEVRKRLAGGLVKTLLLSDELDVTSVSVKCSNCDYSEQSTMKFIDLMKFESELNGKPCPKCGNLTLYVAEKKDMIDDLSELAETAKTEVEIISHSHEDGEMLYKSFGGIVAILRYSKN